ncbi:hypothetical protein CW304_05415 [Bacillus sp. UFRGS-B20]|nr:hypothetical protein CW304_05415 [Bacillus sp. UFRGS-B20]
MLRYWFLCLLSFASCLVLQLARAGTWQVTILAGFTTITTYFREIEQRSGDETCTWKKFHWRRLIFALFILLGVIGMQATARRASITNDSVHFRFLPVGLAASISVR